MPEAAGAGGGKAGIAELISLHLGNQNLKAVFPSLTAEPANFRGLLKIVGERGAGE